MPEGDRIIYSWVVINRWGDTTSVSNFLNKGAGPERGESFLPAITYLPIRAGGRENWLPALEAQVRHLPF